MIIFHSKQRASSATQGTLLATSGRDMIMTPKIKIQMSAYSVQELGLAPTPRDLLRYLSCDH